MFDDRLLTDKLMTNKLKKLSKDIELLLETAFSHAHVHGPKHKNIIHLFVKFQHAKSIPFLSLIYFIYWFEG